MIAPTRDDLIERAKKEVPWCSGPTSSDEDYRGWRDSICGPATDNFSPATVCHGHAAIAAFAADYADERLEAAAVKARHRHTKKCIRLAEPADPRDDVGACTCTSEDIRCAILELKSRPVEDRDPDEEGDIRQGGEYR